MSLNINNKQQMLNGTVFAFLYAECIKKFKSWRNFMQPVHKKADISPNFPSMPQQSLSLNIKAAQEAHLLAAGAENPKECHAEVGVLCPNGSKQELHLGKDEEYGAHRVGSVTKTFTTLLALKLVNSNLIRLDTKCGELIDRETLELVFEDPDKAAVMTLEQLLSHTAGLEKGDHSRDEFELHLETMEERLIYEGREGNKYKHTNQPGDGIGSYSNAGFAIAAWMLEIAYNKKYFDKQAISPTAFGMEVKGSKATERTDKALGGMDVLRTEVKREKNTVSFSNIIKYELFNEVFDLSGDTYIAAGPGGDIIGAGYGDMTSSIRDLLRVAQCLQQGEEYLAPHFGQGWHKAMLAPRDLFGHHGLGCEANSNAIQHAGLNCEIINGKKCDVTALAIFPLRRGEPGLVAMCDSSALGPLPSHQNFADELKKLAGIPVHEKVVTPQYELAFFCPTSENTWIFKGDAYVVTDVDPFSDVPPKKITCTRNGMKHELTRNPSIDAKDAVGYTDGYGKRWMMVSKGPRKMIYSDYCLVSPESRACNLTQPSLERLKAIEGVYKDENEPDLTYVFTEREGHLYFQEGNDNAYPALYLPEENFWVVSLPEGRKDIKFRFPDDPREPLIIVDISTKIQDPSSYVPDTERLLPKMSYKK